MLAIAMLALELSAAVSGQSAQAQPVRAELVRVSERRPGALTETTAYQRVEIAYRNTGAAPIALRSCAADARLSAFDPASGAGESDGATAFGVGSGSGSNWSSGCRETTLSPGQPVTIAYYIRGAGRGRGPRALTIDTSAGRFIVDGRGQPAPGRGRRR